MSNYYGPHYRRRDAGGGGGGGSAVQLFNEGYLHTVIDPSNASAGFTIHPTGQVAGTGASTYAWLNSGVAADYEVRVDETIGSLSSGTTGTWISMTVGGTWTRTRTVIGLSASEVYVQMRRASDGVVLATATKILTAEVDF